jgi:hypothetical protein
LALLEEATAEGSVVSASTGMCESSVSFLVAARLLEDVSGGLTTICMRRNCERSKRRGSC